MRALHDPAATCTILSSEMFDSLKYQNIEIRAVESSVTLADNSHGEITGIALQVPISFLENSRPDSRRSTWKGDVVLMKGCPYSVILGINTLRQMEVVVDYGTGQYFLGDGLQPNVVYATAVGRDPEPFSSLILPKISSVSPALPTEEIEDFLDYADEPEEEEPLPSDRFSNALVTAAQSESFARFLEGWKNRFASSPGKTSLIQHKLYLKNPYAAPVRQHPYPMSPAQKQVLYEEVDRLLAEGTIKESLSPYSSPTLFVKKKTGGLRMCIDYRKVNEQLVCPALPLPRIQDILNKLKDAHLITCIDLKSGFSQIPLDPTTSHLTAFSVPGRGLYEYVYAPFGLASLPGTFQRLMEQILRPVAAFADVYMDDIIVWSQDYESHITRLGATFECLRAANLSINWAKTSCLKTELSYLGYVVGGGQLKASPDKIRAIASCHSPRTAKQIKAFLGMCGWFRRFVPNFAELSSPLLKLLRKGIKFEWSDVQERAFVSLKEKLISAPVLRCPNFELPFEVHCDASNYAVGAALMQTNEGGSHVISYFSRILTLAQRNYSICEKELLAVLLAVQSFRPYLYGTAFTVVTDHSALKWLSKLNNPTGRLARWASLLSQYDMNIVHRKGTSNVVPDALSRIPAVAAICLDTFDVSKDPWYEKLLSRIKADPESFPLFSLNGDQIFKLRKDPVTGKVERCLVIPSSMRPELLRTAHADLPAAHLGIRKTFIKLAQTAYWPKMYASVSEYVRRCRICQACKPKLIGPEGLMTSRCSPMSPVSCWTTDLVGPLPRTAKGNQFILVFVDVATKWPITVPLKRATAATVAQALLEHVIPFHGVPEILLCDNGSQYTAHSFQDCCNKLGITLHYTPRYFPQANMTERVNQVIKTSLRCFAADHKTWDTHLSWVTFAIRTSVHETTGFTPARLLYGRELRQFFTPPASTLNPELAPFDSKAYVANLDAELKGVIRSAQSAVERSRAAQAKRYNLRRRPAEYQRGELVWKRNFHQSSKIDQITAKLLPLFEGPYTITNIFSDSQVELTNLKGKVVGRWHVSHLKPFI